MRRCHVPRFFVFFLMFAAFQLFSRAGAITTSPERWPVALDADGLFQAVGEISIKNELDEIVRLKKAEIILIDEAGNTVGYRKLGKAALSRAMVVVSRDPFGNITFNPFTTTTLQKDEEGIIFLEARGSTGTLPVSALITLTGKKKQSYELSVPLDKLELAEETAFPLPPEAPAYWIALNTSDVPFHRLALYYKDEGLTFVSQRYAVDFIMVDGKGRSSIPAGSGDKEDYFAWDSEIRSVAGGGVTEVVDGNPDMDVGMADEEHPGGNYVVIKHAEGWYSFYAHMRTSSTAVTEGETVQKGQLIGRLGNSGHTSEPHLHIQFMDRWTGGGEILSLYEAQGIPMPFWGVSVKHKGAGEPLPLIGATLREQDVVVE
jgi:hypothetical protein